jgi:small subunit ribosomal protein S7
MRRRKAAVRVVNPDAKYHNVVLAKMINCVMERGKKSVAEQIVYDALDTIETKLKRAPLEVFKEAIDKVRPNLEVKSRRVGGATYQVPMEVSDKRGIALAIRWLVLGARTRKDHTMSSRLANEIMDCLQDRGTAIKKREDMHRMAEANRAFAHFKW